METKLEFTVKTVYGRDLFYPQNKQAAHVAALIGKKTLTTAQIKVLIEIGFKIISAPIERNFV